MDYDLKGQRYSLKKMFHMYTNSYVNALGKYNLTIPAMKTTALLFLLGLSCQVFAQSTNQSQGSEYWNAPSREHMVKKAKREAVGNLQKGSWGSGVYASYGPSTLVGIAKHLGFNAFGGYFIDNKLLIGFTGEAAKEWESGTEGQINSIMLGPMLRYYITSTRIAPFTEVYYQLGSFTIVTPYVTGKSSRRSSTSLLALTGGLSVRLYGSFRAEAAYKFQTDRLYPGPLSKKGWVGYPQAGVSAFF
jgi:hypothetical protein